jgi:hypothetical protein
VAHTVTTSCANNSIFMIRLPILPYLVSKMLLESINAVH